MALRHDREPKRAYPSSKHAPATHAGNVASSMPAYAARRVRRVVVLRPVVRRAAGFFAAVFLATGFFAADFLATVCFATGFFATGFFAAAFLAAGFLAAVFFTAGFFATGFFAAVLRAAGFLAAAFLTVVFFAAGLRLATVFFAAVFFATGFFATGFLATVFLAAVFLAVGFFAAVFFTTVFCAAVFFTVVFFAAGFFFAVGFFAAGFIAVAFFAVVLRAVVALRADTRFTVLFVVRRVVARFAVVVVFFATLRFTAMVVTSELPVEPTSIVKITNKVLHCADTERPHSNILGQNGIFFCKQQQDCVFATLANADAHFCSLDFQSQLRFRKTTREPESAAHKIRMECRHPVRMTSHRRLMVQTFDHHQSHPRRRQMWNHGVHRAWSALN